MDKYFKYMNKYFFTLMLVLFTNMYKDVFSIGSKVVYFTLAG